MSYTNMKIEELLDSTLHAFVQDVHCILFSNCVTGERRIVGTKLPDGSKQPLILDRYEAERLLSDFNDWGLLTDARVVAIDELIKETKSDGESK